MEFAYSGQGLSSSTLSMKSAQIICQQMNLTMQKYDRSEGKLVTVESFGY